MVELVDAARLLWCQGLAQTTGKPDKSLHEWLATATYAPSVSEKKLTLTGIDQKDFLRALGFDINRLTSAASETLRNVVELPEVPKSLGWPYVKLYYSALFYAHSLLRTWGRSPSYLRTADFVPLRNTINAYNLTAPFPLQTGQFLLVADLSSGQAVLTPDKGGGGSHDAVWREFAKAILDLKTEVGNSQFLQGDKAQINAQLDAALKLLTDGGAKKAWPSFMRNEIHYRQSSGVWYPYRGHARTSDLTNDIIRVLNGSVQPTHFLGATGDDLVRFRSACLFTIALVRQVLDNLSDVGGTKTFVKFGQARFETAYP